LGVPLPKFLIQKKNYPSFVTLKTETFTKMTAISSKGSSNTGPGFCTAIVISKLSLQTKTVIADILGFSTEELLLDSSNLDNEEMEVDPAASQDYPEFSQTQSNETLKVCEVCSFN
jgi:hypothetical protein